MLLFSSINFRIIALTAVILLPACENHSTKVEPAANDINEGSLSLSSFIPFSYSLQGTGRLATYSSSLEVDAQNVHITVYENGEISREATLPIDLKNVEAAIAELTVDQLNGTSLEMGATIEDGFLETITSPLGEVTFFRHPNDEVTPSSAAIFSPLAKLVLSWKARMLSSIPGETIDQEIIEAVGEFVKVGMSRQTLLKKFPNPNYQTNTQINYQNWSPALVTNATRKGTYAITIYLENDVIVSWSWSGT